MNCTKCGNENREGANFCQACGQPLKPCQGPGYANTGYYYPPYQGYQCTYPPQGPERKDGMVALLLAFLIPGAGHFYVGEAKKGIVIFASFVIIGSLAALAWFAAFWSIGTGSSPILLPLSSALALIVLALIWLYQMYDAYQSAMQYNASLDSKRPY